MKTCTKCQTEKPLDVFYSQKETKDQKKSWCKECCRLSGKEHYLENEQRRCRGQREDVKEYQKKYRLKNSAATARYQKKYAAKNKEKLKAYKSEWDKNNPERLAGVKARHHKANKERYRPAKRARERLKMKTDPMFKLHKAFSHRLRSSLKSGKAGIHWENILGYSIAELKEHLEGQFRPGMNWKNHGKWHIDHILPVASFNYLSIKDADFMKCWALENLQPLWAIENMRKGVKILKKNPCSRI